jgi:hypothetical protein
MPFPSLPLEVWQNILELLDILEAIAIFKAHPRFFGAFINSMQGIRFRNAINSYMRSNAVGLPVGPLASFVCSVMRDSSLEFSSLLSWLARRLLPVVLSSIVVNPKLFKDISSTIALKDRGFVSVSSSLSCWAVEMYGQDEIACSISWILLYRASLSGYKSAEFHRACNGMGKCVVVVKAENGRIAVAYNEDGFFTFKRGHTPNLNGFIACVDENGECGEIFHRTISEVGIFNSVGCGPWFGYQSGRCDLVIDDDCHQYENSLSMLGTSYGGPDVNQDALFR